MAFVWLLDVEIAGRMWRFATERVSVPTAAGAELTYAEGLEEPSASWASSAAVQVTVHAEVDWALAVAQGHALDRRPAVLRRWLPGRSIERARVVARGMTAGAVYDVLGQPLTLSIVRDPAELSRNLPPDQAVISAETWPVTTSSSWPTSIAANALGRAYPLVIGLPGYRGGGDPVVPCVPVPVAQHNSGLGALTGANRAVWLGGNATTVRLQARHVEVPETETVDVLRVQDLLGRWVQYVELTDYSDKPDWYIGFGASSGGGVESGGELVRGAGQVLLWVLRTFYAGAVDWGRVRAVAPFLDNWLIDTWISDPANAWEWLGDQVLSLLPVEVVEGSDGLYLALTRRDLTAVEAVAFLDTTTGHVQREGGVSVEDDAIVNEVTVDYRPGATDGGTWLGQVTLSARGLFVSSDARPANTSAGSSTDATVPTADARVFGSTLAAESQLRYGVRSARVAAAAVWSTSTAVLVARQLLARHALPVRVVSYSGGPDLEDLDRGVCVLVTDPELHLVRHVARVRDVAPTADGALVELELLDYPRIVERPT